MMSSKWLPAAALIVVCGFVSAGCESQSEPEPTSEAAADTAAEELSPEEQLNAEELAKLSPAERAAVEKQKFCLVSTEGRLGSMGPPVKVEIDGQTVYLCCEHCEPELRKNPEKYLKNKLAEKADE